MSRRLDPRTLELAPEFPPYGRTGVWEFGAILPGEPQRSAKRPTSRRGVLTMKADDGWAAWRATQTLLLQSMWRGKRALYEPVFVQVTGVFSRPERGRDTYTLDHVERPYPWRWTVERVPFIGRPDADQIQKAALDVLVRARVLVDDTIVEPAGTPRYYAAADEEPRTEVRIWRYQ